MKKVLTRIYVPGGILSPGELRRIANTANYVGVEGIHLGNRQDILLEMDKKYSKEFSKRLETGQYDYESGAIRGNNIMTSFPARNIFNTTPWLGEGIYMEILSEFNHTPRLKINIVDPLQSLVPLFSGDLNFIASVHDNYWFLYIRYPGKQEPEMWPVLVDGNEIAALSEEIGKIFAGNKNVNSVQLEASVYNARTWNFRIIDAPLELRNVRFPNYEGFHPAGERYWLGIYNPENTFPVSFIDNLCILCAETNIGCINITPWNSFLIKNIDEKHIELWERLLGKHGINTGHSQLELNWQLPELDRPANKVKQYLYKAFEKKGLRTDGLIFGVSTSDEAPPASIVVRKKSFLTLGKFNLFSYFEIKYRKDFNPNASELVSFAGGLKKRNLPDILAYLTGLYYERLNSRARPETRTDQKASSGLALNRKNKKVHQCRHCLTIYDATHGDELSGIIAGTPFQELPADYKCTLCESGKESFEVVTLEELLVK